MNLTLTRTVSACAALVLATGTLVVGAGPDSRLALTPPAAAGTVDDPALDQTIDEGEELGGGQTVLDAGHIDIGPYGNQGNIQLAARDDTQAPPVWRELKDLVIHIPDEGGKLAVPDDPTYEFLGVEPETEVWLIPQVEEQGVPWMGWNTQYPGFAKNSDSGIDLAFHGMQGPGDFTLYLQNGTFGDPDVYWQSAEPETQSIHVDPLTHTHANWVFTDPGIYLLDVSISAEDKDGKPIEDRQTLRVAVGSDTDPQQAFGQEYRAPADGEAGGEQADDTQTAQEATDENGTSPIVYIGFGVAGVLVLALIIGIIVAVANSRKAKSRAESELAQDGSTQRKQDS